ncbi:MAG: CarD family transcriptional regulator, partial [Mangrovibacterium sp.]
MQANFTALDLLEFRRIYSESNAFVKVFESIRQSANPLHLRGMVGSLKTVFASALASRLEEPLVLILGDKEEAAYAYDDLINLKTPIEVLFFPSSYKRSVQYQQMEQENVILRTEVLTKLREGGPLAIVTYPEALVEKVITGEALASNSFTVRKGDKLSIEFLNDVLFEYGFERVDFVFEPGQYSIRGSLVDLFSFANEDPYRLDFFGDEVDSIRSFDIENQISIEQLSRIVIIPNIQSGLDDEKRDNFLNFISPESILQVNDLKLIGDLIDGIYQQSIESQTDDISGRIISGKDFLDRARQFKLILTGNNPGIKGDVFESSSSPQPVFNKNFPLLAENMQQNIANGYRNFILSNNEKQIERLKAIFNDQGLNVRFTDLKLSLHEGFVDHDQKICCYTDHQIFERYHRFQLKSRKEQRESITIKELNKLHPGDYVVHIDHGIGKFAGLVKTEVNGTLQEAIRLTYRDNDVLLVSIHSLHRISKYKGKDGVEPKISKLGSGAWQKLKEKTKSKVKDIARDLIDLYAKRRQELGFAFTPDSYLQTELEASFIFEDTPDQLNTTQAVKEDMERPIPMDRLVCGDVGFGKTEIAVRAAFKAATDGKQVAILVPTTILALQHYKTFSERLKDFPVRVDYVSRLRPAADVKQIPKD